MGELTVNIEIPPDAKLGPAMQNLNERQKKFVTALLELGGINGTKAAMDAGYCPDNYDAARVQAHRLMHDENIQLAIREEADRRLRSGAIMAVQTLLEIANNATSKDSDRLKAVEMLLNRSGLHSVTEHNVKVEHRNVTDEAKIAKIVTMAKKLNLDPVQLLGSAGITIDAEFKEVTPAKSAEIKHRDWEYASNANDDLSDIM